MVNDVCYKYFYPGCSLSFHFLVMSIDIWTFLILMMLTLSAFFFIDCAFCHLLNLCSEIVRHALVVSSKSFLPAFLNSSWIFVFGPRQSFSFILLYSACMNNELLIISFGKICPFSTDLQCHFVEDIRRSSMAVFLGSVFCSSGVAI